MAFVCLRASTHFHADHAFGAWALLAAGMKPCIVTEERFVEQVEEDMRTHRWWTA